MGARAGFPPDLALPECTLLPSTRIKIHTVLNSCTETMTGHLCSLCWCPVCECIHFKLALLMCRQCAIIYHPAHLPRSHLATLLLKIARSYIRSTSAGK